MTMDARMQWITHSLNKRNEAVAARMKLHSITARVTDITAFLGVASRTSSPEPTKKSSGPAGAARHL